MVKYKCHSCKTISIPSEEITDDKCPVCGANKSFLNKQCENDCLCHCAYEVNSGVAFCQVCGEPECPVCGSHDVAQISRVTGYLQEVSGWNSAKQQELRDRQRYDIAIK